MQDDDRKDHSEPAGCEPERTRGGGDVIAKGSDPKPGPSKPEEKDWDTERIRTPLQP